MNAGRRIQGAGIRFGQLGRTPIAVVAAAGDDHGANAGTRSASHHIVTILVETVMREIRANVDQLFCQTDWSS
jgi:hypothetical protein